MRLPALVLLVIVSGAALARAEAPAQRVEVVTPLPVQRVDPVAPVAQQRIEAVDAAERQGVTAPAPRSAVRRTADAVGKVTLGVLALGVSLGFAVASLLFF